MELSVRHYERKYGVSIPPRKIDAFIMTVIDGISNKEASERLGVSANVIRAWSKEAWWRDARTDHEEAAHERFKTKMMSSGIEVLESAMKILKDDHRSLAMPKVKMLELFAKAGDKPIIQHKNNEINVNIDNRSINFGEIDMDKVDSATEDELKRLAMGDIPVHFRKTASLDDIQDVD